MNFGTFSMQTNSLSMTEFMSAVSAFDQGYGHALVM